LRHTSFAARERGISPLVGCAKASGEIGAVLTLASTTLRLQLTDCLLVIRCLFRLAFWRSSCQQTHDRQQREWSTIACGATVYDRIRVSDAWRSCSSCLLIRSKDQRVAGLSSLLMRKRCLSLSLNQLRSGSVILELCEVGSTSWLAKSRSPSTTWRRESDAGCATLGGFGMRRSLGRRCRLSVSCAVVRWFFSPADLWRITLCPNLYPKARVLFKRM